MSFFTVFEIEQFDIKKAFMIIIMIIIKNEDVLYYKSFYIGGSLHRSLPFRL